MGAGSFKIKVKSKDGKFEHLSPNINVLPSAISVENYEQMLKELLFIRDDLVINKDSKIKINTIVKNNLDEINKILDKLYIYLNRINNNPKVDLVKICERKSDNSIKKMCSRTLKEKILKPYYNKFTVPVYKESLDTYENQVIKYSLYTLENKINFYKKNYLKLQKNEYEEEKNHIQQIYKIYDFDKMNLNNFNIIDEEKIGFMESIKNKTKELENRQKDIKLQEKKWEECSLKIKKLLDIDFIKKVSLKKVNFKSSQIVANDKNYLMVWKNLKKLKESNLIYDSLGENFILVRDTQNIYEY
ncbi:hypothetical protein Z961_02570 [Clostridium haemolyticum NCTC 8350]|uniref:DUF2357 domain-containing protein n=1 Tax=Clostridium haemolyticum TaxID=84025 RepID=UPI00052B6A14|nr:DUF2357 domain-containing protein [Clostridium haemolyticum]KGN04520.1 hypothetical protein Z961_02570 [Clostridium haemolyticum NCTC 8350]